MASIFDLLTQQLGGEAAEQIGRQVGLDRSTTEAAMPAAVGSLMAALAGNSAQSSGAAALDSALAKDHDGSILDNLGGFLSNPQGGSGILKHVLGGRQKDIETGIGQVSGIDAGSAGQLLKVLAPIVMGALGKAKQKGGLDAGGLASVLAHEKQEIRRQAPKDLGMLGSLLDSDGDGSISDDVAKLGGSLLKNLLKR